MQDFRPNFRHIALAGAALLLAGPVLAQSRSRISQETLDAIQRECLRAYPAEMRAKMSSGAKAIPEKVEAEPETQMSFLDKELEVEKGLFYPSLLEEVQPALEKYVEEGTRFLDLGSGDGRVLFLANALGAHATGIEWDENLVNVSLRAMDALGEVVEAAQIDVVQGDFFESSWAHFDVIFYFDTGSLEHDRLRRKMKEELLPEAFLVIGHEIHPFEGFELVEELGSMRVYRQPAQ